CSGRAVCCDHMDVKEQRCLGRVVSFLPDKK
ncbi:MAG: hypothetical protein ACI9N3_001869, partial [Colwellia sp.]